MLVLGCPFSRVTITAEGDSLGVVTGGSQDEIAKYENGKSADEFVRNGLIIICAGQAAVNRKTGRRCRMYGTDHEKVISIASKVTGSSLDSEALLEESRKRAKVLIDDHWCQVEAVANALLVQRTLTGDEVRRLIN